MCIWYAIPNIIPHVRVGLENIVGLQLYQEFPAFYGT